MGIRFHCPNGHKLHVKGFLAGKRGICPECGVKVIIPATENAANQSLEQAPPSQSPAVAPPAAAPTAGPEIADSSKTAPAVNVATPPSVADPPPAPPASGTQVAWHLRIPTGEQFGPIDDAGFQGWIAEGRVSDECLVWQAGWEQWQSWEEAKANFPSPAAQPPAPPPEIVTEPQTVNEDAAIESVDMSAITVSDPADSPVGIRIEPAKPRSTRKSHRLVYSLVVVCFCLLIVLLYVLTRNS